MTLRIEPSAASCGALIFGADLSQPHSPAEIDLIRDAWLKHQVIGIHGQELQITDLERFAAALGPDGDDPFIASIAGHPRVVEVRREANETTPVFAEAWHSDWSFLKFSPAGTLLYGKVIPPVGGDTLFANQYAAYDALTEAMKAKIADLQGIHSARRSYSPGGVYGERDKGRSMAIRYSEKAMATQLHPLVRTHSETRPPRPVRQFGIHHRYRWHERCGRDRTAVRTLRAPEPPGVHLPASLVTRTLDPVGQSLRFAYRDRRLSRPSARAMANYDRRAARDDPHGRARPYTYLNEELRDAEASRLE